MSKKLYTLISTCVNAAGTVAAAIVSYCQPAWTPAIVVSIGIGCTAVNDIMVQFVSE